MVENLRFSGRVQTLRVWRSSVVLRLEKFIVPYTMEKFSFAGDLANEVVYNYVVYEKW